MKIVVVTCLWGREEISRIVLDNLRVRSDIVAGSDGINVVTLACGSEGDKSRALAESCGAEYMEHDNEPLAAKYNAALAGAMALNPDAVMILGSDCLVNEAIFISWAKYISDGMESLGILDGYVFDTASQSLVQWNGYRRKLLHGQTLGSGRCFSRKFLDTAEWRMWDSRKNGCLDWSSTQRINRLKPASAKAPMEGFGIKHVELKANGSSSPFNLMMSNQKGNTTTINSDALAEWFGVEVSDRVLALKCNSTVQKSPETTDRHNASHLRRTVELHQEVDCPRCEDTIRWGKTVMLGVMLKENEKFVCTQCAVKEQEERRAKRGGKVPEASEIVRYVPHAEGVSGEDGTTDADRVPGRSLAEEAHGGCESEGDDGSAFDYPEDILKEE